MKQRYIFINMNGLVVPQSLEGDDAGAVLQSVLKQNAIVLPVVCNAKDNQDALAIYKDKIAGNLEMLEVSSKKEALYVQ